MNENEKEQNEKEAEKKARFVVDLFDKTAELCAKQFEGWAERNKEASREDAHAELVKLVRASIISSNMIVMGITL